jgi:mRNA interferase MazF
MTIIPGQGAIIMIDAEPHAGHKMGGHDPSTDNIQRPAIVLSSSAYNSATGMVMVMLVSTGEYAKRYPHEVLTDKKSGIHGSIVTWEVACYDFDARNGRTVGQVTPQLLSKLQKHLLNIYAL